MTAFNHVMLEKLGFLVVFCCCGFTSESSGFSLCFFVLLFFVFYSSRLYVLTVRILLLGHSHEVVSASVYFVKWVLDVLRPKLFHFAYTLVCERVSHLESKSFSNYSHIYSVWTGVPYQAFRQWQFKQLHTYIRTHLNFNGCPLTSTQTVTV